MENAPTRNTIGRYEILGSLAAGGMAEIFLGRLSGPSGFARVVVVKRILPHLAKEKAFVEMFLDEARTVARIRHQNVVQVHELGEQGELFLVMEYLEGESVGGLLRRLCARDEVLDPFLAAHIVAEACRGLHAAHELSDEDGIPLDLVHRDISPQNLFVTYDGSVKVLDFGIAKVADRSTRTEAGHVKGKFGYMSPEQCLGKPLDRRSDVFALGTVLHELLTNRRLFKRSSDLLILKAICEQPVPAPSEAIASLPPELDRICARALARQRDDRYESAAAMGKDLLAAMRSMARTEDPQELLARRMSELYPDRIAEKREMLRRARERSAVTHIPEADADVTVELPSTEEASHVQSVADIRTEPEVRPRRALAGRALPALAIVGAIAGTFVLATSLAERANAPAQADTRARESEPGAPSEPARAAIPGSGAPAPVAETATAAVLAAPSANAPPVADARIQRAPIEAPRRQPGATQPSVAPPATTPAAAAVGSAPPPAHSAPPRKNPYAP